MNKELISNYIFPNQLQADPYGDGLVAMGGDLEPATLLAAYQHGIFPWFNQGEPIAWWSPEPRCVIYSTQFKPSKSLKRRIKTAPWDITLNQAFDEVIKACAQSRAYADGTWISDDIIAAYNKLHQLGYAHSVEVWYEDELIGGLYGLKLGQAFFGESMFHRQTDASKVAFTALMTLCQASNFPWVDCQLSNNHLLNLGAVIIPRQAFLQALSQQLALPSCDWSRLSQQRLPIINLLNDQPFINHDQQLSYQAIP